MSTPLTVFPDPMLATLDVLRASPFLEDVPCGTVDPTPEHNGSPTLPYVRVRVDAQFGQFPAAQTATIRLVVWGESEAKGLALASKVRAVLLSYEGGTDVRSFGALTGPIPTTDPESGHPVSYLTVAARLRPHPLS